MKILNRPRRSGKTTKMIEWLMSNPKGVLIVPTQTNKEYIENEIVKRLFSRIVVAGNKIAGIDCEKIGIDELDAVLRMYVGYPIEIATRSGEEE